VGQDFAKRKPSTKGSRKNVRNKTPKGQPPWLWLATGLCTGLLLGFLYHLAALPSETINTSEQPAANGSTPDPEDSVHFNFYTLLPEREVMVSQERQPVRSRPEDKSDEKPASSTKSQNESAYQYYLQAGSFQQRDEAEKRRIQLILLGLEGNIENVKHQGKSWYRVQSGPYLTRNELASAQTKLSRESIDTLVTKRKPQ
jgi:cell division protein FtsN